MITVRFPAWRGREVPKHEFYYENRYNQQEDMLVRAPVGGLPEGTKFLSVILVVDPSGAAQDFVEFLLDSIRRSPDGRVSRTKIWTAWADKHGVDSSSREITGLNWADVPELFRTAFNAGEMVRKRLDGEAQRVWLGFELVSEDDGSPQDFLA